LLSRWGKGFVSKAGWTREPGLVAQATNLQFSAQRAAIADSSHPASVDCLRSLDTGQVAICDTVTKGNKEGCAIICFTHGADPRC
jgi:hypothetical protein